MNYFLAVLHTIFLFFTLPQISSETGGVPLVETVMETNERGRIPILEYHSIGQTETRWTRSAINFKKDLNWLYKNDYVLLSIEDYARNYYPIPRGKKPVILTFDDGKGNQFRYLENDIIDPDCAVGILDEFYKQYPDFGTAAVFYVNRFPFGPFAEAGRKIEYLHKTGRQIGYHTLDHDDLRKLDTEGARVLLEKQKEHLKTILPADIVFSTLAYPHGWGPSGSRTGLAPLITVGLLIGAEPAYPLYHEKADAYRTPRIQAIDQEWLRHFGRQPGETAFRENAETFDVFISDGVAGAVF